MAYEIRWARESEWQPAMKMIWRTFLKFEGSDYTREGIKNFFDFITDDRLYIAFLRGDYRMMVAVDAGEIIGAASLRSGNLLSLLFVDENYQGRGIGSGLLGAMCGYLEREAGETCMTLQAAPCAVGFYRKQGFETVKPEEEISGIRVTKMEKIF